MPGELELRPVGAAEADAFAATLRAAFHARDQRGRAGVRAPRLRARAQPRGVRRRRDRRHRGRVLPRADGAGRARPAGGGLLRRRAPDPPPPRPAEPDDDAASSPRCTRRAGRPSPRCSRRRGGSTGASATRAAARMATLARPLAGGKGGPGARRPAARGRAGAAMLAPCWPPSTPRCAGAPGDARPPGALVGPAPGRPRGPTATGRAR